MGTLLKLVVAFGIGLGALTAAQHLWMSAMQQQIAEGRENPFPQAEPLPSFDPDKTLQAFKGPQIDTNSAAQAGFQSQMREMDLRNRAAEAGAPQIANGIPTMPGQGVPHRFLQR